MEPVTASLLGLAGAVVTAGISATVTLIGVLKERRAGTTSRANRDAAARERMLALIERADATHGVAAARVLLDYYKHGVRTDADAERIVELLEGAPVNSGDEPGGRSLRVDGNRRPRRVSTGDAERWTERYSHVASK